MTVSPLTTTTWEGVAIAFFASSSSSEDARNGTRSKMTKRAASECCLQMLILEEPLERRLQLRVASEAYLPLAPEQLVPETGNLPTIFGLRNSEPELNSKRT